MLAGLRQRHFVKAVLQGLGAVMVWPWAVVLVFVLMTNSRPTNPGTVSTFFLFWFLFSALYDAALAQWAKDKLLQEFRDTVAGELPLNSIPFLALQPRQTFLRPLFDKKAL
jgi:hypothetical protein